LRKKFEHEQWDVRREAVKEANDLLEKSPEGRIIRLLLKALRDKDWHVRMEAAATFKEKIDMYVRGDSSQPMIGSAMKPFVVDALIKALRDEHPSIRENAAAALANADDTQALRPLIRVLTDREPEVRQQAARALKKANDIQVVMPLIRTLRDDDMNVRLYATMALQQVCCLVHTIVLGRKGIKVLDPQHTLCDPDVSDLKVPMPKLKEIAICTTSCDIQHVEAFAGYIGNHIGESHLRKYVTVRIYGNLKQFRLALLNPFASCKQIDVYVETILFGTDIVQDYDSFITLRNPDMSEFLLPLSHVKQVIIYTESHDFHLVERFLTYAVNYIGQKHLKKSVDVHLYGDPEKLHSNLRNNLENLCKSVHVYK
jgi:hypothetical protein